jgi:hypothetical protein
LYLNDFRMRSSDVSFVGDNVNQTFVTQNL